MFARQTQWLGSIRLASHSSFSLMTAAVLILLLLLVTFACISEITRKVTVRGVLLPVGGLIAVAAPQPGVISEAMVHEGERVVAGQPLLRIRNERRTSAGDLAAMTSQALEARRSSLQTQIRLAELNLSQRSTAIVERRRSLLAEERQALAELETHRLRLALAEKSVERQKQLAQGGFVAGAQVQQKEEELLDIQLRERNADRNLQALRRDLQSAVSERQSLETQTRVTLSQIERELASLSQESTELDEKNGLTVVAPQAGQISALNREVGQPVQTGQTLLSLLPAAPGPDGAAELQALLFAPSRTTGFVRAGQEVWLRYAAFPYQKFGMAVGHVVSISRSPIAIQDLPAGQAEVLAGANLASEPMYRITVRLPAQDMATYGYRTPLAIGMTLDADIKIDRRKVLEWIFEPVIAVQGRSFGAH